ncbi:rRNA maturation RNase YbeY [Lewinellaceae bacterium SD302]|nr:rRNA maturation RNase YbeY [Lewinellaceae bacterium SD302]
MSAPEQNRLTDWINRVIRARNCTLGTLNYIFCDDDYLHKINVKHLQHDTLTDIITFPMQKAPVIGGDIFVSTERVADNAKDNGVSYEEELRRVLIHGVLHLTGQGDKTEKEAREMRQLENWALKTW